MILDNIKTPFRASDDPSQLDYNRCSGFRPYKLITPNDRLLPFIVRYMPPEGTAPGVASFVITNVATGAETDLSDLANMVTHYRIGGAAGWNYYVYKGEQVSGLLMAPGYYNAVMTLADNKKFYFEQFWVDCETAGADFSRDWSNDFSEDFGPLYTMGGLRKYTKIQWWHSCDIGNLLYQTGYQNVLYIDSDLIRDVPEILEEGDEDGNKDFVATFIKYTDKISMVDLVPDHVLNALLAIPIHDHVLITTKSNLYIGKAKRFECTPEQVNDCYYKVDLKFQHELSLYSSKCCQNNALETITA